MRISDWSSDVCSSDLEPLKRVVPLDLFPTNVLETIEVQKTYSAKMPGEFGGGVINLSSAVIPEEAFLNIKLGTGGNSETTFQPDLTHYGGSDSDLLGYDDGTRTVSADLQDAIHSGHPLTPGRTFQRAKVTTQHSTYTNSRCNTKP